MKADPNRPRIRSIEELKNDDERSPQQLQEGDTPQASEQKEMPETEEDKQKALEDLLC